MSMGGNVIRLVAGVWLFLACASVHLRALDLTGVVMNSDKKPVVGALVSIDTARVREGTSPLCPSCYRDCVKSAVTDVQGRFTISNVSEELFFNLIVVARGHVASSVDKVDPQKGPITATLKVRTQEELKSRPKLQGRVVDAQGKPIERAVVTLEGADNCWGGIGEGDPLAVADARGEFFLLGMPGWKTVNVRVQVPGFASKNFVRLPLADGSQTLTLERGVSITGRLVRDGVPVANVNMGMAQVDRSCGHFLRPYVIGTDKNGRFLFTDMPRADVFTLYALRDSLGGRGVTTSRLVSTATKTENVIDVGDVAVVPGQRITGQLVLTDGKPVPAKTRLLIDREDAWDPQVVTLDEKGRFEFLALEGDSIHFAARVKGYDASAGSRATGRGGDELTVTATTTSVKLEYAPVVVSTPANVPQLRSTVLQPDGKPAAQAEVVGIEASQGVVVIRNGRIVPSGASRGLMKSDAQGAWSLPQSAEMKQVVIVHPTGYARVSVAAAAKPVTLTPWGHVEGTVRTGKKPAAGREVLVSYNYDLSTPDEPYVAFECRGAADDRGRYRFDFAPVGLGRVGVNNGLEHSFVGRVQVKVVYVKAGETVRADVGGEGAVVRGKVLIPDAIRPEIDWEKTESHLSLNVDMHMPDQSGLTPDQINASVKAYYASGQGIRETLQQREYGFPLQPDGSFVIEDVLPGKYHFQISFIRKGDPYRFEMLTTAYADVEVKAGQTELTVPPIRPAGVMPQMKRGDKLPDFSFVTLEGKKVTSPQLRGKAVLLWFGQMDDYQMRALQSTLRVLDTSKWLQVYFVPMRGAGDEAKFKEMVKRVPAGCQVVALESSIQEDLNIHSWPTYVVVAADGTFYGKTSDPDRLKAMLAELLTQSPAR